MPYISVYSFQIHRTLEADASVPQGNLRSIIFCNEIHRVNCFHSFSPLLIPFHFYPLPIPLTKSKASPRRAASERCPHQNKDCSLLFRYYYKRTSSEEKNSFFSLLARHQFFLLTLRRFSDLLSFSRGIINIREQFFCMRGTRKMRAETPRQRAEFVDALSSLEGGYRDDLHFP